MPASIAILIHGSPCQDMSIAGHQGKARASDGRINRGKGAKQGSGTRSSLMWETIHIIEQMGKWKPRYVIWENVKNVTSKHMIENFVKYQKEMEQVHLILRSGSLSDISLDAVYECRIRTITCETVCTGMIKERYENRAGMILVLQVTNGFYEINLK